MKRSIIVFAVALLAAGTLAACGESDRESMQAGRGSQSTAPSTTPGTPGTSTDRQAGGSSATGMPGSSSSPSAGPSATSSGSQALDKNAIQQAEQQLQAAGFNPGTVDGVVDGQTRDAVRKFQQEKNLKATGELTPETLTALNSMGGTGSGSSGAGSSTGSSPSGTGSSAPGSTGSGSTGSGSGTGSGQTKP
jgi:peptidoglycan hydrolase-like protein with peptidoglycan-binding domain